MKVTVSQAAGIEELVQRELIIDQPHLGIKIESNLP